MSGHGSTGGLLTVPKVKMFVKQTFTAPFVVVVRMARTIVNKKDAFGGGGRDIRGQRTELYGGAHLTRRL